MWNFLGGAVGALGSIYGAQQNAAAQNQSNVFNYDLGVANMGQQMQINNENLAQQEQFARQSAGWRLSDLVSTAKQVGVNPLSALGVQGSTFSNLVAPQNSATMQAGSPGAGFSQAGQSLGRAIAAIQSPEDRAASALNLEHASLQNDLLRSQIAQLNSPSLAPGVPALSSPPSAGVVVKPDEVTAAQPGGVATAGDHPEVSFSKTASGGLFPEPSKDLSVAMFNPWSQRAWSMRNMLLPMFGYNKPPGMENMVFDPMSGYTNWHFKPYQGGEGMYSAGGRGFRDYWGYPSPGSSGGW